MTISNPSHFPVIHLKETDSTSNYLLSLSSTEELEEFTTVIADFQTTGKGQRGNGCESETGMNLLFSIIMYPGFLDIRKQFLLSKSVALAVYEELCTISDGFSIKWPNDIYWHEKKICGTLIENDLMGSHINKSVAGIGINVNQKKFTSHAPNPVSLLQITGKSYNITHLLNGVVQRIIAYYILLKEGGESEINQKYHNTLFRKDGMHRYRDSAG